MVLLHITIAWQLNPCLGSDFTSTAMGPGHCNILGVVHMGCRVKFLTEDGLFNMIRKSKKSSSSASKAPPPPPPPQKAPAEGSYTLHMSCNFQSLFVAYVLEHDGYNPWGKSGGEDLTSTKLAVAEVFEKLWSLACCYSDPSCMLCLDLASCLEGW